MNLESELPQTSTTRFLERITYLKKKCNDNKMLNNMILQ